MLNVNLTTQPTAPLQAESKTTGKWNKMAIAIVVVAVASLIAVALYFAEVKLGLVSATIAWTLAHPITASLLTLLMIGGIAYLILRSVGSSLDISTLDISTLDISTLERTSDDITVRCKQLNAQRKQLDWDPLFAYDAPIRIPERDPRYLTHRANMESAREAYSQVTDELIAFRDGLESEMAKLRSMGRNQEADKLASVLKRSNDAMSDYSIWRMH